MKKSILLFLFFGIARYAYSQSDCAQFKTGQFQNIENGVVKSKIERTDSIQIEQYVDKVIKLRVEWIDDCSYRLVFLEGNEAWWESRGRDRPTPDLIIRITNINENSYLQEAKFVGDDDFKYKSNIRKIE